MNCDVDLGEVYKIRVGILSGHDEVKDLKLLINQVSRLLVSFYQGSAVSCSLMYILIPYMTTIILAVEFSHETDQAVCCF